MQKSAARKFHGNPSRKCNNADFQIEILPADSIKPPFQEATISARRRFRAALGQR